VLDICGWLYDNMLLVLSLWLESGLARMGAGGSAELAQMKNSRLSEELFPE